MFLTFSFCILSVLATEVLTSDFYLLDQDYYDLNKAEDIFEQFVNKYGKEYDESSDYRFEVFKQNLENINKWNKESGIDMFGINAFTDMTYNEFSKFYLGFNGNVSSDDAIVYKPTGIEAPASLDWRNNGYVSSVKDQGNCGSCFCFSAIGDIEGQYAKNHGTRAISLSVQQGLDCESQGDCVFGGLPHNVFRALAGQGGSMREEDYPYQGSKGQCKTQKDKIAVRVTGGDQLYISSENEIKEAVAGHGPLSISICVDAQFKEYKGSVVYKPTTNSCSKANHAVLLVGYGNDGRDDYWIIKNSWGTQWGEQGFMRIVRGRRACAFGEYVASSTVA